MTQGEKDMFIRFNALLEELKDVDASIQQVKVLIEVLDDCLETIGII